MISRRLLPLPLVICGLSLAACGGGGGTSAADLERRLLDPGPFENEDPVVTAKCPEDLAGGSGAEVVCTTTTRRGVVSKVTVRNRDGGIAFDSVIAGAPTEAPEPTSDPADETRLERDIRKTHDGDVGDDASRKATAIVCPDDFEEETGESTRCELTTVDGSVLGYEVRVRAKRTIWFPDPVPRDMLANLILADYNGGDPRAKGESVECPEQVPVANGTTTTCALTTVDGETRDVEVTMTDDVGNLDLDY